LAAVGTLAAGIAHEIRNPLVAIHTFAQLLPEHFDDPEFRATFSDLTNSELERVSTLINDLMAFARPSPVLLGEAQINDLIEQVVRLLSGQARKQGTILKTQLSPTLPPLVVDQGQMKQVLLNLLQNALQATESDGTVTVTTATVRGPNGQEYCELAVQDTGPGIPPEQKEKIFDPFFTTKSRGTGLGLSIVHQIIKEHGGFIDVESTAGQGTRFFARLPLTSAPSSPSLFNGEAQESLLPKEISSPHPL
jgi:signal transduction histidine kinase